MKIEQIKYIITTKQHILCCRGFVLKNRFDKQTLRLFATRQQAKNYLEKSEYPKNIKYNIIKINVKVEVLEDDSEYFD